MTSMVSMRLLRFIAAFSILELACAGQAKPSGGPDGSGGGPGGGPGDSSGHGRQGRSTPNYYNPSGPSGPPRVMMPSLSAGPDSGRMNYGQAGPAGRIYGGPGGGAGARHDK